MWPNKKGFGSKKFLGLVQGPAKLVRRKIWVSRNLDFLTLNQNWRPKIKNRIQLWAIDVKYMLTWSKWKRFEVICPKKDRARAIFVWSGRIFWYFRFIKYIADFHDFWWSFANSRHGQKFGARDWFFFYLSDIFPYFWGSSCWIKWDYNHLSPQLKL